MESVRQALEDAAARRLIAEVADSWPDCRRLDIDQLGLRGHELIWEFCERLPLGSPRLQRLAASLRASRSTDDLVKRLGGGHRDTQLRNLRILGALRLENALPWMAPLLASPDPLVRSAAARTIGRIGGRDAAQALLLNMHRRGATRTAISQLAVGAPDQFLESELRHPRYPAVRWAAAAAAGLRRRRSAVGPLVGLLESGNRRERAVSCRALGWIGAAAAIPAVAAALQDRDPRVRASAMRSLAALQVRTTRLLAADRAGPTN